MEVPTFNFSVSFLNTAQPFFYHAKKQEKKTVSICFWDGKHCLLGSIPNGTTPFIYEDNLYYTPVGCCSCPLLNAGYDDANCYIMKIPDNVVGRFYNNIVYLSGVGNTNYPYDEITGYDISTIESWLNGIFSISNLETKLKANKPSGITDKHIDLFLDVFYNL